MFRLRRPSTKCGRIIFKYICLFIYVFITYRELQKRRYLSIKTFLVWTW